MGGKRFKRTITGSAPLKQPDQYRIVGTDVARADLPAKVAGQPSFVQDLRLPGMLHGRVVRPPSLGATLVSLDEDIVRDARVVRLGNFVGVVAEREEQVIGAAASLQVAWRETASLPTMADLFDALRRGPTVDRVVAQQGAVEAALAHATTRLSAVYYQPYQAHASIGPSCAVAAFDGDQMTVWCSSQGVYPLRGALADLLELPLERVRVIHLEGAGCYGHNGADDVTADAALLARAVGRPVRVQWSREDEFVWEPKAPAMVLQAQGGLDERGNVAAWDFEAWSPSHANRPRRSLDLLAGQLLHGKTASPSGFFFGGDRNAPNDYAFPNSRVTMHWLERTPLRSSSMRSLGGAANTFANESFMDELAVAAGANPLEFRLRHLDDPRARDVLEAAAQRAAWGTPLPPGQGRGIAFAHYENTEAYVATVADVQVDAERGTVRVRRVVVAHDCGLIINPDGVRNQIEGNVIQSVSRALKEEVRFDTSHVTSVDWESYPILTFSEVPDVAIVLLNRPDQPAVGAGEPATITTAAAIANAIYAATGARLRQVPFTPERVRAALHPER
jgi:nicotinate dehydrogenase subunit B